MQGKGIKIALATQTPEVTKNVPVSLLLGEWQEKLEKARKLPIDGLELMPAMPEELDAGAIRRQLQERNLSIAAVGTGAVVLNTGLTLLSQDAQIAAKAREKLHRIIAFAGEVEAPLVTIGGFRGRGEKGQYDAYEKLAEILCQADEWAKEWNIRIVLEPLNRYESNIIQNAQQGIAFVRGLSCQRVGLLLDTFHMNLEERSMTEPFRQVMEAGLLWHVHVGDNNRLPVGGGAINFKAIVQTLREIGYEGYLSAELLTHPDGDIAAGYTARSLHALLETDSTNKEGSPI
ncbi:MAG: TIM barrel protein [Eubacteriales bacterium]|jgi:sugar phosphate isomerase/epimerase